MFAGLDCQLLTVAAETPDVRRRIDDAAALLRAAGYGVTADIVPGQADAIIAGRVESDAVDLLVMGAYGHRSEEHTSELQSLMRISYAVFCLKKKKSKSNTTITSQSARQVDRL